MAAEDEGFVSRVRDLFDGDTDAADQGGQIADGGGEIEVGGDDTVIEDSDPLEGQSVGPVYRPDLTNRLDADPDPADTGPSLVTDLRVDPAGTAPGPPPPDPEGPGLDGGFGTGASGPILDQPVADGVTTGPDLTVADDSAADGPTTSTEVFDTFVDDTDSVDYASIQDDSEGLDLTPLEDDAPPPELLGGDDVPA